MNYTQQRIKEETVELEDRLAEISRFLDTKKEIALMRMKEEAMNNYLKFLRDKVEELKNTEAFCKEDTTAKNTSEYELNEIGVFNRAMKLLLMGTQVEKYIIEQFDILVEEAVEAVTKNVKPNEARINLCSDTRLLFFGVLDKDAFDELESMLKGRFLQ